MNKVLKATNFILLFIVIIILSSFYTHLLDFSFIKLTLCTIIILVLLIINIIQLIKKNNILNNKNYNILLLLSNIAFIAIFLRDKFDSMIPLGSMADIADKYNISSSGAFFDYNSIFIIIMYMGTLLYNLINKDKKIKK